MNAVYPHILFIRQFEPSRLISVKCKKLISSILRSQFSRISWEFFLVLKLWQPVKSQMLSMRFVLPCPFSPKIIFINLSGEITAFSRLRKSFALCCVTYISDNFVYFVFKFSRISRTELFAARSADFAVDFTSPSWITNFACPPVTTASQSFRKASRRINSVSIFFSVTGFSFILTLSF